MMKNTINNVKKINFILKQGNKCKKLFKISFVKNEVALFISFPYFNSTSFHCGTAIIPSGTKQITFDAVLEGDYTKVPLKMSYHEDGGIHFKQTDIQKLDIPPFYKNAKIKGTPIKLLKGEHIFTIQFEGLDNFDDFKPRKKSEHYLICNVPDDAKSFKFVGYAGFSEEEIKGKYGNRDCIIIEIKRQTLPIPLLIGIYLLPSPLTISENEGEPFLLSLVGFEDKDLQSAIEFLYMYAK